MNASELIMILEKLEFQSPVDAWRFYASVEKLAKTKKDSNQKVALTEVKSHNDYLKSAFGGVQSIDKESKSAKESLQFYLKERGLLDLCRNDSVDLNKVNDLIDAGKLNKEEVYQHIKVSKSSYLKSK